ncbi:MAG: hypothetical protein A3H91_10310 [Gammaproteobacteria bacterium RIFCSPLOWO2_02_FULL_61_13]|nr:MAG: hypothetical protein A3H91_10310 [Gammaproteobacteria bacterium RIFCSPLOWO2_02_FULL_61_13]
MTLRERRSHAHLTADVRAHFWQPSMEDHELNSLADYLGLVEMIAKDEIILFRGQNCDSPLLPKIARPNPKRDTTDLEQAMLQEVRRRGALLLDARLADDWELLVYVQNFGMATRLLDWTSNPLVALWFACQTDGPDGATYVFAVIGGKKDLLDRAADPTPFEGSRTKIFKPGLNNARIIAQSGWFTVHRYSSSTNRFVPLEQEFEFDDALLKIKVPNKMHADFLHRLDLLGVNYQSLFPDVEGLCKYITWLHTR